SLLIQLEAFAENRARDHDLDLSLKPASDLTDADVAFMVENFFHAQRRRMIDVHPRYAELAAKREKSGKARRFAIDELPHLQVWHKLAWIDPEYLDRDDRIRRLVAKDRNYGEDDKQLLREVELEILNK